MSAVKYEVVIIGSGIGGLVCGCYLAKNGIKVLIVEKNKQPGGYCTSFRRRGFVIDTTIHALQNCEKGNILHIVFSELNVIDKLNIVRRDPTDTIVTDSNKINIQNNVDETIANFQNAFPKEARQIDSFFEMLSANNFLNIYAKYKFWSFQSVLDSFFRDQELKEIFSIFLGNIGSLPENTSALSAIALLKQFILSGGYYPLGGMQEIPNALVEEFKRNGGSLVLGQKADQILFKNHKISGVKLENDEVIESEMVVSNSDLVYTFTKMLSSYLSSNAIATVLKASPSYSIYIVYLMINKHLRDCVNSGPGLWYVPSNQNYKDTVVDCNEKIMLHRGIFCSIASKLDASLSPAGFDQVRIMTTTKHYSQTFWKEYGVPFSELLIKYCEKVIPQITKAIVCEGRATSITMRNYTLNSAGAVCGWMNSIHQVNDPITTHLPKIDNLFFAGHWITEKYGNGGVAMAADSGRKAAKSILKRLNRK